MKGNTIKRFFVLAGLLVLFILSCDDDSGKYHIYNNSGYTVTYVHANSKRMVVLKPGKTESSKYPILELDSYSSVPMVVSYKTIDRYNAEFVDHPPIPLEVLNNSGKPAKLTAAGCMDVPAIEIENDSPNTDHVIYTSNPDFSVLISSGSDDPNYRFPATVNFIVTAGKIMVTIN